MSTREEIPRLSVTLAVRHGAQAIEFYKKAFGAEELFAIGDEEEGMVAQLAFAGRDFWLADESPENQNFSPQSLQGRTSVRMMLIVDDPQMLFDQAVAAGASIVRPITDEEYGWRVGRVVDPFGHHWEIGKPLS